MSPAAGPDAKERSTFEENQVKFLPGKNRRIKKKITGKTFSTRKERVHGLN